jgi:ribosomal protein S18 acetylase RimI-like enzyme
LTLTSTHPSSFVLATDIDVLPPDRIVERRDEYLLVRSPTNPAHHWGNLLIFDEQPADGDGVRWEQLFEHEFGADARVRHRTFAWDRTDGAFGRSREEFEQSGYDVDESIGLVAQLDDLGDHPRSNREVEVRALDPAAGADAEFWDAVLELQVAGRDEGHDEAGYRVFTRARLADQRRYFSAGRGAWYVALDPSSGAVAASCGIVVTDGRARYQAVETAPEYRRRGICSRLVVDAARHSAAAHGALRFVIVADPGYHALGLYESLGFARVEHVVGVCRWQRDPA